MRFHLLTALLLFAWSVQVQAQTQLQAGRSVDLVFSARDLAFTTTDLKFTVVDMGGKTQDLQVKETATEIRIDLAADVLFDFDKSTIKLKAATALHSVAEIIKEKGMGRTVRIEGHTDGKGSASYNQSLSERRANSVHQWLAQKEGLGQVKMTTQGFGASKPVVPNTKPDGSDDPEGRQKNRRVEIVVAK
jgi:outer membrane protein OmpA-like peptidoglycan-associated protein